jgi:flagellar P-ring protein precursor FlgI
MLKMTRSLSAPKSLSDLFIIAIAVVFLMAASTAHAKTTRIKDIVDFEGVRDNQLVGYGLVVGLDGTGDSLNNSPFTEQSLQAMLERLGVSIQGQNLNTGNVAAVMVTASLPPFSNQGSEIDVNVSALGDSESLRGGTLLVTPLLAADGEVYAVAQGPVIISGYTVQGEAGTVTQNIPTAGRIPAGGIVEREIDFDLVELQQIRLALRNPDFTTARRIAQAINGFVSGPTAAAAENSASVVLRVPPGYGGTIIDLITDIEQLPVQPDQVARVIIDERSGVIVMGADVKISTVAIAQSNLTVTVTETPQVSQPNAFAEQGQTAVVPRTQINVNEGETSLAMVETGVTLQELVTGLNSLGVSPRDVITILQAIKAAGALQADIETL